MPGCRVGSNTPFWQTNFGFCPNILGKDKLHLVGTRIIPERGRLTRSASTRRTSRVQRKRRRLQEEIIHSVISVFCLFWLGTNIQTAARDYFGHLVNNQMVLQQ